MDKKLLNTIFSDETALFRTPAEPEAGDRVTVRIRAGKKLVKRASLILDIGNGEKTELLMTAEKADEFFDIFSACFKCEEKRVKYIFSLKLSDETCIFYKKNGMAADLAEDEDERFFFSFTPGFHVPDWAKGAVQYQIFTDRFRNGNPENDVQNNEYFYVHQHARHMQWDAPVECEDIGNFYGGDLQGVMEKLDYLQDLGVEVIYFNPLFVSPSSHKYDTQDYEHIDPHFAVIEDDMDHAMLDWEKHNGFAPKYIRRTTSKNNLKASDDYFAGLCAEVHKRKMKIILDGVFNHCGSFNKWMDREGIYVSLPDYEKGAFQDEDSPYSEYFFDDGTDENGNPKYKCWWDVVTLPKLNYEGSEKLREAIYSIAEKWAKEPYCIDGWRLDVAADLGKTKEFNHGFWKEFRRRIKAINSDIVIIAEHYGDAYPWLLGEEWDTVMNYDAFMDPISYFLTGMEKHSDRMNDHLYRNGAEFFMAMRDSMAQFQLPSLQCAMNELSNHDHSRFLTRTNRKVGRIETLGSKAADEGVNKEVFALAVLMQMTWPGAPTIYYGDEAGMCGWTDPDCRRTYPWGGEDDELIKLHKDLISIRKSHPVFKYGSIKELASGQGLVVYTRFDSKETAVVAVNNLDESQCILLDAADMKAKDGDKFTCIFRCGHEKHELSEEIMAVENGTLNIELEKNSAVMIMKNEKPVKESCRDEDVLFTEYDGYLFGQGTNYDSYKKLGAHPCSRDGISGVYFAVWAPNAESVSVITNVNEFNETDGLMALAQGGVGVYEKFIPGAKVGDTYRFVVSGADGIKRYKSDPYAFAAELRPANASIISDLRGFEWTDEAYMDRMADKNIVSEPVAIYEVHLGSWKKDYSLNEDGFMNYRTLADQLADYLNYMGYTHVELVGICEHPFDGSWGYQCTGFFAPTSRYGTPDDFRYFVDKMHSAGIGVILDWVPAHFPKDSFCMENFDGTALYEYADPLRKEMPGWGTLAFDHGKNQVKSFLISSAFYWIREFHMDAIRVDAVASMLLNNFDRSEWQPNIYGGVENLEGISFLKQLNEAVHTQTNAFMIAEDSSIMEGITKDVSEGGIGFTFKWDLGWMNDTLKYFELDPVYRKYHHGELTGTYDYAFTENFVLVLSHDEVVHLKHSMLGKMPGGIENRLSGLKALYALQFTSPGKKLLFMGQEFAQEREWDEKRSIDWELADDFGHRDVMQCVKNLLAMYRTYPCLYADSKNASTFEWVNRSDGSRNILAYIRRNPWNYDGALLVIANLSPVSYGDYSCGVPLPGYYKRIFSTYDSLPGQGNPAEIGGIPPLTASEGMCDGYGYRINYSLRPNEVVVIHLPETK